MNARVILAWLLPLICCAQSHSPSATNAVPGADFFGSKPPRIEVQISQSNVQILRDTPRQYVPATVFADGVAYNNVGVHLKGVATFRPIDDQPALTLKFDKFNKDLRFHGLRKIHLNNGKEDPSFLCEAISAEMFERGGLPAARVVHGQIRLNGRLLGPYVIKEGFTPEFLARYFNDTRGNLYDSGFRRDITSNLERLSGKKPDNWKDLNRLAAAAEIADLDERWTELARRIDTNSFARYLAMQVLTWNWDGYALYKNNYRVYHDPDTEWLYFMPHGMDQMFSRPFATLMPQRWDGLVAGAFMETPQGRALYVQQLGTLFTNVYRTEELVQRIDELGERLRPLFEEQGPRYAAENARHVAILRRNVQQRGMFLAHQLGTTNWMEPPRVNRSPRSAPLNPFVR